MALDVLCVFAEFRSTELDCGHSDPSAIATSFAPMSPRIEPARAGVHVCTDRECAWNRIPDANITPSTTITPNLQL